MPPPATQLPGGSATWSSHQVVASDTLWDILDVHYGSVDADLVWHVAGVNDLENPNDLAIGQTITLPPIATTPSTLDADPADDHRSTPGADEENMIIVRVGDSLSSIAAAHLGDADRWPDIFDANRNRTMLDNRVFDDPNVIQPGWVLALPDRRGAPIDQTSITPEPVNEQRVPVDDAAPGPSQEAPTTGSDEPAEVLTPTPPPTATLPAPLPVPTEPATNLDVDESTTRPVVVAPTPRPANPGAPADTVTQPGDRAATPPAAPAAQNAASGDTEVISTIATLAAGGLALTGLVTLLDRRRRRRRTLRPTGRSVAPPAAHLEEAERIVRRSARLDIAERINAAIRSLGPHLAALPAPIRPLYVSADDDTVTVFFDQELHPPAGWNRGPADNSWICTLDDHQLSTVASDWTPWPALVPLGTTPTGAYILVDLEAVGILSLSGDDTAVRSVLAALIVGLSSSPFTEMLTVLDDSTTSLHRLDQLIDRRVAVSDVDELIERLSAWPLPLLDDMAHLLAVRGSVSPDCEPCIAAISTDLNDDQRRALAELDYRNQPLALITTDPEIGHTKLVINSDHSTALFGHTVICHHLDPIASAAVADLIDDADSAPFVEVTPAEQYANHTLRQTEVIEGDRPSLTPAELKADANEKPAAVTPQRARDLDVPGVQLALDTDDTGPYWNVRVLGDLEIDHSNYGELTQERQRELLTLLSFNTAGLTSGQIGVHLFPLDQSPAETKNAAELEAQAAAAEKAIRPRISDLRRALGGGETADGHRYLPRAKSSRYRATHVHLDADHMFALIDAAHRCTDTQHRINALAAALQLVRGPIGRGEFNLWSWPSQTLADIEAGIIDAGLELAELASAQQSWKLADWAATRTQLANPDEQRGLPYAIRARRELGDRAGIQRLYATTTSTVDQLEPNTANAFNEALARHA